MIHYLYDCFFVIIHIGNAGKHSIFPGKRGIQMKRFAAALLLTVLACSAAVAAPVQVTKTVRDNPTLYVGEIAANPAFSKALKSFLAASGWFDLSTDPAADYKLTGKSRGNSISIQLEQGGAPVGSWSLNAASTTPRKLGAIAADAVIEKTFKALKVRGFCQSKVAFCAVTAPGIRNIYTCDIDGGNPEQITNYRSLCMEPAWSANGKTLIFSKYNPSSMSVIETTLAQPRRSRVLSNLRGINAGAAPSPDGGSLAVILSPDRVVDLYTINLRTGRLRRLTRGKAVEASPAWSPDGSRLVFVSDQNGRPRLYTISRNGGSMQMLPSIGADAVTPDWSSDNKIVYATRISGSYTLAVLDLSTGKNTRVTNIPGNYESPTWAADNRQIVCKRSQGTKSELCVVDTWTGKVRLLLSTNTNLAMPVWSSCPVK